MNANELPADAINIQTAAKLLRVDRESVYRWIRRGKLRGYRVAGWKYWVSRADVLDLIKDAHVPPPPKRTKPNKRYQQWVEEQLAEL